MNTEKVIRQLHSFLSLSAENIEFYYSKELYGKQWLASFTINFRHKNNPIVKDFMYDLEVQVYLSDTNIENITVLPTEHDDMTEHHFYAFCRKVWEHLHSTWKNLYWKQVYYKNGQHSDMENSETCVFYAYPKNYKEVEENK